MPWELTGNSGTSPATDFLGTTDNKPLVIKTQGKEALRIDPSGSVGLGTSTTSSKLEIAAQDGLQIHGFQPFLTLKDSNSNDARARIQTANGDIGFMTEAGFATGIPAMKILNSGTVQIAAQDALQIVGFQPFLTLADSNSGFARARIQTANGDINFFTEAGFATGIPAMKILNSGTVQIVNQTESRTAHAVVAINHASDGTGAAIFAEKKGDNGHAGFFAGNVHITRNLTVDGDVFCDAGDCAEDFDIADAGRSQPGTVMVLGDDGALYPSQSAYDKRVVGVVSGAGDYRPAIVLDKRHSSADRKSIALLGKVFCKADASSGPIGIGDLLTTSDVPGHAMKAVDPASAFGAVIGKALRPLAAGQGLILILVTLQ